MHNKIIVILGLSVGVLLAGLAAPQDDAAPVALYSDDNLIEVSAEDPAVIAARENARRQYAYFRRAFRNRVSDGSQYQVKFPLRSADGQVEQIWAEVTELTGHGLDARIIGVLANDPAYSDAFKLGMKVEIDPEEISDWAIFKADKIIGGWTMRLFVQTNPDKIPDPVKMMLAAGAKELES
ncbi:MAG: DUF2314 domain-containing protein [Neomegalonema sp.]|nr:DUF2314 domain-containing protein [Neomegalonema sp.]